MENQESNVNHTPEDSAAPGQPSPQTSAQARKDSSAGRELYQNVRVLVTMMALFVLLFTFVARVIVVSGPVMGMLADQGAATISTIDTQAIGNAISGFLPRSLASSITELFSNMITILWYSGVQILIFLSALQKIDSSMYEAAQMDGGSGWECFWKITLPTIKPMILLNVVYTVVFISGNEQNSIITLIQDSMFSGTKEKGYGYASAMAWLYSLVVVLIVVLFAVLLMARRDVYERQVKRAKRERKKEARTVKRIERRGIRNAKKIEKARAKRKYRTYDGSGDY